MTIMKWIALIGIMILLALASAHGKLFSGADVTRRFQSTAACETAGGKPELAHMPSLGSDKFVGWKCARY